MEAIQMSVLAPNEMPFDEVLRRAKALVPCKTGTWEDIDEPEHVEGDLVYLGLLECEAGFYEKNPNGAHYGPDDAGVGIEWETP